MRKKILVASLGVWSSCVALAQINVSAGGESVRIGPNGEVSVKGTGGDVRVGAGGQVSVGPGNQVKSSVGEIAPGTNLEGVTIINGKLWIDGQEVPPGVKQYKSPKTGKVYRIERQGKNVSVTSQD